MMNCVKHNLVFCLMVIVLTTSCGSSSTQSKTASPVQESPNNTSSTHRDRTRGPRGRAPANATGIAGTFDFYVMSLSWSPGFCATPAGQRDPMQCGGQREYGFVLHGLWPQYDPKGWPEDCSTERVDAPTVQGMLSIMPSPNLVQHEWQKHGTCSGLSPQDYFDEATEAYQSVKIPARYEHPAKTITVSPEELLQDFVNANPNFKDGDRDFAILCSNNGRYLQEVRVCLGKDLKGRSCNQEVLRDQCPSREMIMRPVR
jgi:ribonuclease T2